MFARALVATFLILSSAAPAFAQIFVQAAPARRATAATPAPSDRARQWLTLVDDKNYTQSWNDAGTAFKTRQKAEDWAKSAGALRAPMGAMSSRDLKSIDASRNTIAVIRYDTAFAHKATAVETVTLSLQNGGWSVTDYSIQ